MRAEVVRFILAQRYPGRSVQPDSDEWKAAEADLRLVLKAVRSVRGAA